MSHTLTTDAVRPASPLTNNTLASLFLSFPHHGEEAALRVLEHDGVLYGVHPTSAVYSRDGVHWYPSSLDAVPTAARDVAVEVCRDEQNEMLCLPFITENGVKQLSSAVDTLRIWKRRYGYQPVLTTLSCPVRFSYRNRAWHEVDVLPYDEGEHKVEADIYDVVLTIDTGLEHDVRCTVLGVPLRYDVKLDTLYAGDCAVTARRVKDTVTVRVIADKRACLILCGEAHLFLPHGIAEDTVTVSCDRASAAITALAIYGLRSPLMACDFPSPSDAPLYETPHYRVYPHHVADTLYGEPFAYVPDRDHVYSPTRVTEAYQWEHTPWGDMQRVTHHDDWWCADEGIERFPDVTTGIPTFDAAYRLALSVLDDASNDRFAIKSELGMWSAGAFQGNGFGFGVWRRDTAQITMRGGNLLDPAASRKSILYTLTAGFDNGMDGMAMPSMALWDYYVATGDTDALREGFPLVKENLLRAVPFFDETRCLFKTDRSSSNDAFEETEAGGYHLSTEIYLMAAMEAAVKMAAVVGDASPAIDTFRRIGQAMRAVLAEEFYNPAHGFFCVGPRGSEAFERGCWETCGVDAAIGSRFGIASDEQRRTTLQALRRVAYTDFGIPLMPHHRLKNHFTAAVWVVYYTGIAEAAAKAGDGDLLFELIAQQVRNLVINKTFYEIMDTDTGLARRWPDQTWQAMGFVSVFLNGVFGICYDEDGLTFAPYIPKPFKGIALSRLRYRDAVLNITTEGFGEVDRILLNGEEIRRVPTSLTGEHTLRFICRES